ncbi:beta-3-deoxy-D-manno-oct-2-ulosonic acid transferase [Acidithiobacillus caldus]|uniref:Capsular biosynthesis protein n=1 Tax=Acidithiobacillus caldus TaxID=33059 RepID=A0A1E7YIL3_9PROT|nr:beta-3-deoxy-D-manno-oct-2-ulosonic acid transferase [Acidithiobacillus caldus]OFC28265.1 capsular biosynthesis protein [Acidithiobacillus caldus]OFC30397.1 capsular biosynthesis protein [Acidithiobacillus caldus]OFC41084.1 capsular biosynthesis protein [Acidithiobacillus caldus]
MARERFADLPDTLYVWSFPVWKWRYLRRCFPGNRLRFVRSVDAIPPRATLILWGLTPIPEGMPPEATILRMEDGFLRSVGLGAELTRPLSWVVDRLGMYYDARTPSELERILSTTEFSNEELERAEHLRAQIVAAGVSKYNVGLGVWQRPTGVERVLIVPGQVESDAAIHSATPCFRGNLELLRRVRAANPDAYIVYKPHPDVEAGLRAAGKREDEADGFCDEVLRGVPMEAVLAVVDEVHTLTSLAGFEGLLRGRKVHCYGQPFYAGWGLTTDHCPIPRRQRRLSLDALVAGTLIRYPTYIGRRGPINVEDALAELIRWKHSHQGRTRWWREPYRWILRRAIGVR